jgi:hypothetical protein
MDEGAPTPRTRPELAVLVDWLRVSGRVAQVDYPRLLHDVVALARRAALPRDGQVDLDTLACACDAVQTQLAAAAGDHDAAARALLREGVIPIVRALGYNPLCFLVDVGVLTEDEIADYVASPPRRNPPEQPSQISELATVP